ncbi:MAG: hypothetical protein ABIR68_07265 [Ilumatobacteraceae bacterium]
MNNAVTWIDRLRIERAVWLLDQRLYDLPRRSRIAKRREVRVNLIAATRDVGASDAVHHLGDSRRLAHEYLAAELGDGPRHSWVATAVFAGMVPLLFNWLLGEAASAFADGVATARPNVTGTFDWHGIRYLQDTVTYTFVDGRSTSVGGAWTPLLWAFWLVGAVLAGRLWRLLPVVRRRRTAPNAG